MRFLYTLLSLGAFPLISGAQGQSAGAWLDSAAAPIQWNRPGAMLPKLPEDAQKNIAPEYCKGQEHPVKLEEERAVARAGWKVFVSYQGHSDVTVVGGAAGEDGMCRPDPYQFFVFVRRRYAGTLSPTLMRARSDGSINKVSVVNGKLMSAFSRYTPVDPLCCPSRVSEATYEVVQDRVRPVVRLVSVQTGRS